MRPLTLEVRQGTKRKRLSTGYSIHPSAWNARKQSVKVTAKQLDAAHLNAYINRVRTDLADAKRDLQRNNETVTLDSVLEVAKGIFRPTIDNEATEHTTPNEFIAYWRRHASTSPEIKTDGTRKVYKVSLNQILAFDSEVTFASITLNWYREMVDYLRNDHNEGLKDSTIGRTISKIKAVLRAADADGIKVPQDYKHKAFKTFNAAPETVALTSNEVSAIENVSGLSEPLHNTRIWWLVAARTGLRFGDLMSLTPSHFQPVGEGMQIVLTAEKTGDRCCIPVHPYVANNLPLDRLDIWPYKIENQKFNLNIKAIAEKAGLTDKRILDGAKPEPLYSLITAHTARRTFATELYRQGADIALIMAATGHSSEAALKRYLRLEKSEKAEQLASHPFFQ